MKKLVKSYGIEYIVHFTRMKNLDNILKNGLKSRKKLEKDNKKFHFNDSHRNDNQKDAICCSVCHPNYKMFYKLRQEKSKKWVVLLIKKNIIWKYKCAFCTENASSNNVTSILLKKRKGKKAFKKLYGKKKLRKKCKIFNPYPTNPQAEILVFNDIKSTDIISIVFENQKKIKKYKKKYKKFNFKIDKKYFQARKDYSCWTK